MQTLTLSNLFMAGCCLLLMPGMVLAQVRIQTQFPQLPQFPQFQLPSQVQHIFATASASGASGIPGISDIPAYQGADREPRLIVDASLKQNKQDKQGRQDNTVQNSPSAISAAATEERLRTAGDSTFFSTAYNINPVEPESRGKQPGL
jgi:hypothetical protein